MHRLFLASALFAVISADYRRRRQWKAVVSAIAEKEREGTALSFRWPLSGEERSEITAGCYPLTKSQATDTTYSAAIHKGRYPSGTVATLNCPGKGYTEWSSIYTCNGEKWESYRISICARHCTFDVVKGMHYSMVMVDGIPTRADIPHRSSAELVCGRERHMYYCQDGFLSSWEGKRCDNCAVELARNLGFTDMQGPSYGDALHGSLVYMQCRGKWEPFRCLKSSFVPTEYHPRNTFICGCPPVKKPKSFVEQFIVSTSPVGGDYTHGTTVNLSCVNGPVKGVQKIKCVSGSWDRPLGVCTTDCKFGKTERDLGFSGIIPVDMPTIQDGQQVYFKCGNVAYPFQCIREEWQPVNHPYTKCGASPATSRKKH